MRGVVTEGHVPQQSHPIKLYCLPGLFRARQRGRGWNRQSLRVRSFHVERQPGLRVRQWLSQTKLDILKIGGAPGGKRSQEGAVSAWQDFATRIVRQTFAEIADPAGIAVFIAVVRVRGNTGQESLLCRLHSQPEAGLPTLIG